MYLQGSTQSEIVDALGVGQSRVAYWQSVDRWTRTPELPKDADADTIKKYLRENLGQHLRTLSSIIEGTAQDRLRVVAITEYAKICKLVGALDLSDPADPVSTIKALPEFDDQIPEKEVV